MFKKYNIKILFIAALVALSPLFPAESKTASAAQCPALKIIFARGSGGIRWEDSNYLSFKNSITEKLDRFDIDYEVEDLDYPAIGMNIDSIWSVLGAYFGSGDSYEFGMSVDAGINGLIDSVNNRCPNTRYVLGGYSQGAMVVSKALHSLNADKIIYAATFGDPKIYLPEGEGLIPAACYEENLSDYRMYVPDCRAFEGLLGSYRPYQPTAYVGKLGTWCNKYDIFCSSHFSLDSHVSYVEDNLYEDASKVIAAKVLDAFGVEQKLYSAHDTAFLIDSTGSMSGLIDKYKEEALNLAKQTLDNGGRVALYDYRDLKDPYSPVKHCDFETCNIETFQAGFNEIKVDGGGDEKESLLSASFNVMRELKWKYGSTKSLVVLTDNGYHNPDIDGVKLEDVVKLSKEIDPVNIYVVTTPQQETAYDTLSTATGGMVASSASDLNLVTNTIMERYDSLPKVEEEKNLEAAPNLEIDGVEDLSDSEVKISFRTDAAHVVLVVNEAVLGIAEGNSVNIGELDRSMVNTISLIPLSNDTRGASQSITLEPRALGSAYDPANSTVSHSLISTTTNNIIIPKAPNTGKGN